MTTIDIVDGLHDMAPAALAELVLDVLRRADHPLSTHAASEALVAHDVPRGTPGRADRIAAARQVVGPTLVDLRGAGRVEYHDRGGVAVWSPIHPTTEIEERVGRLEATLGGRRVRVVDADRTDPVVMVKAPLSAIEAIGR